ncbi:hypothetical protein I350_06535 [Cryptococcus amylolentus CBS 6273]|uniref:Uncharacterized protein n=1 Tax=Cryptococcus amylolentus CBS 6273 TaxID=1296118 RepID=A0A1E3JLF6_9TREE|nr:hypothetical protein I350_06535 [Cryptococcus amylolentus CBS 6273]
MDIQEQEQEPVQEVPSSPAGEEMPAEVPSPAASSTGQSGLLDHDSGASQHEEAASLAPFQFSPQGPGIESLASKIHSAAVNASEQPDAPNRRHYIDAMAYHPHHAQTLQSRVERVQALRSTLTEYDNTAKWMYSQLTKRRSLLNSTSTIGGQPTGHIDDAILRAAQSGDWDQVKMIESEIGEVSSLIDAYGWDWSACNEGLHAIDHQQRGVSLEGEGGGKDGPTHLRDTINPPNEVTQLEESTFSPGQTKEVRGSWLEQVIAESSAAATTTHDYHEDPLGKQLQEWGRNGLHKGMPREERTAALRLGHDSDTLAVDLALCDTAAALIQIRNKRSTWNSLQSLVSHTYDFDASLGPRGNLQSALERNDFKSASSVLDRLDEMGNVRGPTSKSLQQLSDILGLLPRAWQY